MADLVDASLTGAQLRGLELPAVGSHLDLQLDVPCHRIRLRSTVMWNRDAREVGVRFDVVSPREQLLVNNALLEALPGHPDHRGVLLVLDDSATQSALGRTIHARGYRVISRSTPLDALQALASSVSLHIAVVSATLPNRGAFDLLHYLADEHPGVHRCLWPHRHGDITAVFEHVERDVSPA